ncbi:Ig-like domain-containing protein [Marinomonas primoryensis]|uniref:Ig-like domain-containing protein n=1 Tax=Marinomonas primoryensis TaxID=178399 RepID=A0ABV0KZQ3_9GAMM
MNDGVTTQINKSTNNGGDYGAEQSSVLVRKIQVTDQDNAFFEQAKAVFYEAFYSGQTAEHALGAASDKLDELSASSVLKAVSLDLLNDIDFSHLQQEYGVAPFNIVTGCESIYASTEKGQVPEDDSPFKNDVLCILVDGIAVSQTESQSEIERQSDSEQFQSSTTLILREVEEASFVELPEIVFLAGNEEDRGEEIAFSGVESVLDDMEQLDSSLKNTYADREAIDTRAPAVAISAVIDDVGSVRGSLSSGDSTDDTYLLLSGTVEAGSTVTIYSGSVEVGKAMVTGSTWSYTVTINNSVSYQFNAKATDAAGNESAATTSFLVTGDTKAPDVAMTAVTDDVGSVMGSLSSGDGTDDTYLLLSGTVEAGSTVTIYNGSVEVGKATVTGSTWSYTVTINNSVSYQFNAKATDATGNESATTASFLVIGDSKAPDVAMTAMTAVTDDVGSVTGSLSSGDITDDTGLLLSGTVEAGSTVKIYNASTEVGVATVDTNGDWTYSATITNGTSYQFNVKATDAAGNESTATSDFSITADTTAPTAASSNAILWDISQGGSNTTLDAGDTMTVTLSEAVRIADLQLSDFTLINGHSWGAGAELSAADDDGDGYADSFEVTLGTGSTAVENDKITVASDTMHDKAGNTNEEIGQQVDTSIVVFDLVAGTSSNHSGRIFDLNVSYTVYIVVDSDSEKLNFSSDSKWLSAENLGADDKIVLVGNDEGGVLGKSSDKVTRYSFSNYNLEWRGEGYSANTVTARTARLSLMGSFIREYGEPREEGAKLTLDTGVIQDVGGMAVRDIVDLWNGGRGVTDVLRSHNFGEDQAFGSAYATRLPASIAVTQPMT